jgi:hypothetical protein
MRRRAYLRGSRRIQQTFEENTLNRRLFFTLLAAPTLFVSALPAADQRPTAASAEVWARTELYFGTNKPDNTEVTDTQFQNFIDNEVTPRFPDGLTLLTGNGQFRNSAGVLIREKSHILILFYPVQTKDANKKIQDIRGAYKSYFAQESVLRADSLSLISF